MGSMVVAGSFHTRSKLTNPVCGLYADATNYFFWIRADYFCRHLLGDASTSVDMIELNKEKEQSGDKRNNRGGAR